MLQRVWFLSFPNVEYILTDEIFAGLKSVGASGRPLIIGEILGGRRTCLPSTILLHYDEKLIGFALDSRGRPGPTSYGDS